MKKLTFLSSLILAFIQISTAQLELHDIHSFGRDGKEVAKEATKTPDGGWILLSEWTDPKNGVQIYVTRLDDNLEVVWEKEFGGVEYDLPEDVVVDQKGDIWIAAYSTGGSIGRRDYYILHLDQNGALINERFFGSRSDDALSIIRKISDGEILLSGITYENGSTADARSYVFDTDLTPKSVSTVNHPGNGSEALWDAKPLEANQGWMFVGQTTATTNGEKDVLVVETDHNGNYQKSQQFGGLGDDRAYGLHRYQDDWIIAGFSTSQSPSIRNGYLMRVNEDFETIWELDLPHSQTLELHDIIVHNDRFLVTGFIFNPQTGNDLYLAEIDANGQLLGQYALETPLDQKGRSVFVQDQHVIIFGEIAGVNDSDIGIFVYEWSALNTSNERSESQIVFPNPVNDVLQLDVAGQGHWVIVAASGAVVMKGDDHVIQIEHLAEGNYTLIWESESQRQVCKWVKTH